MYKMLKNYLENVKSYFKFLQHNLHSSRLGYRTEFLNFYSFGKSGPEPKSLGYKKMQNKIILQQVGTLKTHKNVENCRTINKICQIDLNTNLVTITIPLITLKFIKHPLLLVLISFFKFCIPPEPPFELKKMDPLKMDTLNVIDIVSISDNENDDNEDDERRRLHEPTLADLIEGQVSNDHQRKDSKLKRQRKSVNQQKPKDSQHKQQHDEDTNLMETSLMIIGPTPLSSPVKQSTTSTTLVDSYLTPQTTTSIVLQSSAKRAPIPSLASHHKTTSASGSKDLDSHLLSPTSANAPNRSYFSSDVTCYQGPLTLTVNTITTTTSSSHTSMVTASKTEPELVLSPAKLGQQLCIKLNNQSIIYFFFQVLVN